MKAARPKSEPRVSPAPDGVRLRLRPHLLAIAAVWALALIAYTNSFGAGLPFDNIPMILENPRIQAATAANWNLIWTRDYWYPSASTGLYRPVTLLTYLFNYAILGNGPRPAGYHAVNFALHAVNIALVYLLGLYWFGDRLAAAGMAALWGVHPALTESVTNVVGRADLLAALGVLAGLVCHVRATASEGSRRILWLAALFAAAAMGMFSKESAVVLIGLLILHDVVLARSGSWAARLGGYGAAVAAVALFLSVRWQVFAGLPAVAPPPFVDNPLTGAGFLASRLSAIQVLGRYLFTLAFPIQLTSDYSYNQIPVTGAADWRTLLALAACIVLALYAVLSFRRRPLVCFCIAFFFVAIAPTANIALLIGTIMAERFLYLPAIAFAAGLMLILRTAPLRRLLRPVLGLLCLLFAARTFGRNLDWHSDEALWIADSATSSESHKAHANLANDWTGQPARLASAIREADRALAILDPLPDDRNVAFDYLIGGVAYRTMGDSVGGAGAAPWYQKSLAALERAARIDREGHRTEVKLNAAQGKQLGLSGWPRIYLELGRTARKIPDPARALAALRYGRTLHPEPEFFEEMAAASREAGDARGAEIALLEGLLVDPAHSKFAAGLVELYRESDPSSCALQSTGGQFQLNLSCPLVKAQFCEAAKNVVAFHREAGRGPDAARTRQTAVGELGCDARAFQ